MDFPFYLFCVYCLSRMDVFLLNSHFLFNNLSRGSGFSQAELLPREGATHTLLARRLLDENTQQRLHYEMTGAASMLRKVKKMQLTLTLNFFFSKKCDADDVKQPLLLR